MNSAKWHHLRGKCRESSRSFECQH